MTVGSQRAKNTGTRRYAGVFLKVRYRRRIKRTPREMTSRATPAKIDDGTGDCDVANRCATITDC